jgi:hypothetical protein
VPPDHHVEEYSFDQYGVRVPALLVSPWTPRGTCSEIFDHTSILKFAIDKWGLAPLGNRTFTAKSIALALQPAQASNADLEIHVTSWEPIDSVERSSQDLNGNQRGLVAYSQYLATMVPNDDPVRASERTAFMMTSAQAQTDTANDHVDRFLAAGRNAPEEQPQNPPSIIPPARKRLR